MAGVAVDVSHSRHDDGTNDEESRELSDFVVPRSL